MAISIAMLLLAISIPIFNRETSQENSLASESELVSAFIVRAQNYAYHPDSPNATAYKIDASEGNNGILQLKRLIKNPNDSGSSNIDDPQNNPVDTLTLSSSTISSPAANIIFSAQSGKPQNISELTVTSKKNNSLTATVTIYQNGSVDVSQD